MNEGQRIAKVIARAGLCSRREAERWIGAGRVRVDGEAVTSPALNVSSGQRVAVDGKPLPVRQPPRLWCYHKPTGLITSHSDPQGRPTVFERLPGALPRVVSVGRLDLTSEGLLLLTNDGELARVMELPATGRVFGAINEARLAALEDGLTIGRVRYGPVNARLDSQRGDNAWLAVSLREGKNREVRNVMEQLGLKVSRLIRVAYGPFQLGRLARGQVREISAKVLREQLGDLAPMVDLRVQPRRRGKKSEPDV
jgi:23S rRNA pseudouridine2605 synthase